jgi:hypothetical protein
MMKRIRKTLNVYVSQTFDVFSYNESLSRCWSKSVQLRISESSKSWSDSNVFSRHLTKWLWRRSVSGRLCQSRSRR